MCDALVYFLELSTNKPKMSNKGKSTAANVSGSKGSQALQSGNSNLPSPAGSSNSSTASVGAMTQSVLNSVDCTSVSLNARFSGAGNGKPNKPKQQKQKQPAKQSVPQQKPPAQQSPAVAPAGAAQSSAGHTQSAKRNKAVGSKPQCNKKAGAANAITKALNEYKYTKVYREAVSKTFKSKQALDSFNLWVKTNSDSIDPAAIVVCSDCGHSDLELCDCWITAAPNAVPVVSGAVLAVPAGPVNIKWRFQWVNRVRRMFAWPTYSPDVPINHNIGFMTNSHLDESTLIIEDMLCYIRQNANTSYRINGVFDRSAKLAHCKKLAIRFLDEHKVPLAERLNSRFVACMHFTVQKATDLPDDDFLLAKNNEDHNIGSLWKDFYSAPVRPLLVVTAAIACPILISKLDVAQIRVVTWAMKRLATNVIRTWVHGSVSIFGLATHTLHQLATAIDEAMLSGTATRCLSAIQQWSCNIARTISSTVCRIASSNLRPSHIMQLIMQRWAPDMPSELQIESVAHLNMMGFAMCGVASTLTRLQALSPSMLYCIA